MELVGMGFDKKTENSDGSDDFFPNLVNGGQLPNSENDWKYQLQSKSDLGAIHILRHTQRRALLTDIENRVTQFLLSQVLTYAHKVLKIHRWAEYSEDSSVGGIHFRCIGRQNSMLPKPFCLPMILQCIRWIIISSCVCQRRVNHLVAKSLLAVVKAY